jgi:acyl-CoA dehydrogenase
MGSLLALDPSYDDLIEQARAVAEKLQPVAVEADGMSTLHPEVLEILRESGLMRLVVPAAHGGRDETVDPVAVCIVREALMAVCSAADSLFALQGIGSFAITVAGTPAQREEWLPKVARGEVLAGLALTEPGAGSDLKAITTTARASDSGEVFLSGHKSFISNAGVAGYYIVLAKEESVGLSAFLVPADARGLSTQPSPELGAPHLLGDVFLDDVILPGSARLGEPGAGLEPVLATLAVFRISVAAASVGLAQVALDEAVRHAKTREQFGRPLLRLGPVAGLLADAWAEVESTRLLTYRVAELARANPRAHLEHSSLAKLAATEACSRVVDRCVQVSGRWGLIRDSRLERCSRQARPMRIYEGASEVIRLGIARQLAAEVD